MVPWLAGFPAIGRRAARAGLFALTVLAVLAVCGGSASAATPYVLEQTFADPGGASSIAVNQSSGDVYVISVGQRVVRKFSSSGVPVGFSAAGDPEKPYISENALTGSPVQEFSFGPLSGSQVAVDNSGGPGQGNIFVTDSVNEAVDVFDPSGTFLGQLDLEATVPQSGGQPCGVAVDQAGKIYVSHKTGHIDLYGPPEGPDPTTAPFLSQLSNLPPGENCNIAVDSTGSVYASTFPSGPLHKYEADQFGVAFAEGTQVDSESTGVAVDASSDDVFVDEGTQIATFSSAGLAGPTFGAGTLTNSHGVVVDPSTHRVFASSGTKVAIFAPAVYPEAMTGSASGIDATSATLSGGVDPVGNGQVIECYFEYGTSASYGLTAPCSPKTPYANPTEVFASISGLSSGTTYHYRVVATNVNGPAQGQDRTLTTVLVEGAESFSPAPGGPFAAAGLSTAVGIADLNGDKKLDLASANGGSESASVLFGDGSGGFAAGPGSPFPTGGSPFTGAIGDLNGDGRPDLVTANSGSGDLTVLLSVGGGEKFIPAIGSPVEVGANPWSVAIGDLNGDGNADLATANPEPSGVTILLGNGEGGFSTAPGGPLAAGTNPHSVAIGDLNGDGNADLAIANIGSADLTVLLGNGEGEFAPAPDSPLEAGLNPFFVTIADLNGDERPDLASANLLSNDVTMLIGNGKGKFSPAPVVPVGAHPYMVAFADLNGDGNQDFVTANSGSANLSVLLGNGSGGYSPAPGGPVTTGPNPSSVAIGDLNGDGKPDLAATTLGTEAIQVFLNGLSTSPAEPHAGTGSATGVGATIATLQGSVDPAGGEFSDCHFDYGTTTEYGQSAPCSPEGPYTKPTEVSAVLSSLLGATTYHFRIVASNAKGTSHGEDQTFTTTSGGGEEGGGLEVKTYPATSVEAASATLQGFVLPSGGGEVIECFFEYGSSTAYGSTAPCSPKTPYAKPTEVFAAISGLSPGTTYHYRIVASSGKTAAEGLDQSFTTTEGGGEEGGGLEVETVPAFEVTNTTGTLRGKVFPGGGSKVSDCHFDYGTTTSYGHSAPCLPETPYSSPTEVIAILSGLSPGTTYHYRIVASSGKTAAEGLDQSFTTTGGEEEGGGVEVNTDPASDVGATSATLQGAVYPPAGGKVIECYFEYGTSAEYGQYAPCSPMAPYSSATKVSAALSGLSPGTTYHFRIVASSGKTTAEGLDQSFTTTEGGGEGGGGLEVVTGPAVEVTSTSATLRGSVFPGGGSEVKDCHFDYGTTTEYGQSIPCSPKTPYAKPTETFATLSGLNENTTYHYRVVATGGETTAQGGEGKFTTQAAEEGGPGPEVITGSATNVGATSATLNGFIVSETEGTYYHFEYGTDTSYGNTTLETSAVESAELVSASAGIAGLSSATTYHFRIVASNAKGTSHGEDQTFTTTSGGGEEGGGLEVKTYPATSVEAASATLQGFVLPSGGGEVIECFFEYGSSTAYGSTAPCSPKTPYAKPTEVFAAISGLSPGTTYHYRIVASSGKTAAEGLDQSFTTTIEAPETTITSGPTGPTKDATPTFTFSSSASSSTFQCRIDSDPFAACSGPGAKHTPATPLKDGPHSFEVRATDKAGHTDPTPASASFTVDTQAPETTIDFAPTGTTTNSSPFFKFSSSEGGATFECHLDSEPFTPCEPGLQLGPLADGAHTFKVRATDAAGNVDKSPASASFTVDTQVPDTTITSGPTGPTKDSTPTFVFASTETGSTFQCRIDGEEFGPCSGPGAKHTPAEPLKDGPHTFAVRAINKAGTQDPTPPVAEFTVDTQVPDTTITSGPTGPTTNASPTFTFSSAEPGAGFECSFDSGAYAPCSSPRPLGALSDGNHSFKVRATDAAGNVDKTPASASFTVDTHAPETTITSGPTGPTKDATPTFAFSSSESGSTFQCRFDSEAFAACSGPGAKETPLSALTVGPHSFEVRATDKAGNTDLSPATAKFTVK